MTNPSPLDFVPPDKQNKRYTFSLRTLLIAVTIAGPLLSIALRLPSIFYLSQLAIIAVVTLTAGLCWVSSFVAPRYLVFALFFAAVSTALLLASVSWIDRSVTAAVLVVAAISAVFTAICGVALALSSSRYDQ